MKRKLLTIICLVLMLVGCKPKLEIKNLTCEIENKFGGVYLHKTIEEFCDLGFEYGDSIDIIFSNGFELLDIPFYDGYYGKTNEPILVAYPGYPYITAAFCNGAMMSKESGVDENTTVDIKLNQKAKYLTIQESLKSVYTNDRQDYSSDEVFANFRCMEGGNLKSKLFYRSASPCDNQYNRATFVDELIKENNIQTIIDLADNQEEIDAYYNDFSIENPYWRNLYENKSVYPIGLSNSYTSQAFKNKVHIIVETIINNDGPYLLHCTEGKDRTGFICALLEALSGYNQEEIENDYMLTYDNYYSINKETNKDKYDAIMDVKFSDIYKCISNEKDSLAEGAIDYLLDCGIIEEDINLLISRVSK